MRIRRLVEQIDEQHREAMRTIEDDLGELHLGARSPAVAASRRRFVRNLGVGGAVAIGAASVPAFVLAPSAAAQGGSSDIDIPTNDLVIVEFAIGLELAAQAAYGVAIDTGLLPPDITELARTFGQHHHEHALALATLAGRDAEEVGEPNGSIVDALAPRIEQSQTDRDVMQVLFEIEQGAAATYAEALGVLESQATAGPAASILPVESQHATAFGSILELPVDEWMPAFQTTEGAFDPAAYSG
jgi:hypothetical protein